MQKMKEAGSNRSSRNRTPVLSILAKKTTELAIKEKNVYSPILKKWHPFAAGVAVATLHGCFGNELKKFIVGLTELTPDTAQVLKAADKLEKDLVHIAIEDSIDVGDSGKSLISQMPRYEAGTVMDNLVKSWAKEQLDRLKIWTDQKLQQQVILFSFHSDLGTNLKYDLGTNSKVLMFFNGVIYMQHSRMQWIDIIIRH
jgi:hypothetical protein